MSSALSAPAPSRADFPAKLACLFEPKRYKILYGGRGSAKSWSIARALLLQGVQRPLRILCAREQQNSIAESVHRLLSDQIVNMGLEAFYEIQRDKIIGPGGTGFFFEGIRHNVTRIKSYEGIDICWVEEAHKVSEDSWLVLVPTIRKEQSEIWLSFNPDLDSDYTYRNFVLSPPPDSAVVFMSWRDNYWFPETLRREMEALKAKDPDAYLNVWEGHCRVLLAGAVYADELRLAMSENRITSVPYDPSSPVDTFWDLGWADHTAIWFRQKVGFEWHYIDYYENKQKLLNHYLVALQERGYVYGTHWLPHDAKAHEKGSGMSIEERMRRTHPVRVVKRLKPSDGVDAARTIFGQCWFDKKRCEQGIRALGAYRYEVQDSTVGALGRQPVHDWSSHAADAFRYSAVATRLPRTERLDLAGQRLAKAFAQRGDLELDPITGVPVGKKLQNFGGRSVGWMGV